MKKKEKQKLSLNTCTYFISFSALWIVMLHWFVCTCTWIVLLLSISYFWTFISCNKIETKACSYMKNSTCWVQENIRPGAVARSKASSLGMQAAPSSIPTSSTFFRGDLVMKTFLRPFSFFCWFKKSSCQLLAKERALSTGKLSRRLAQEQWLG